MCEGVMVNILQKGEEVDIRVFIVFCRRSCVGCLRRLVAIAGCTVVGACRGQAVMRS